MEKEGNRLLGIMESVGDYEYRLADLLGHGSFAMVFKGRRKQVSCMNYT